MILATKHKQKNSSFVLHLIMNVNKQNLCQTFCGKKINNKIRGLFQVV